MTLVKKLIPFTIIFLIVLYVLRTSNLYNKEVLFADLGGVPWLYAVIGTLFGMLAAFAIQKEWNEWNALSNAVRGEVDSLEKLYLWSKNFPDKTKNRIHDNIRKYLTLIITEGWQYSGKGEKNPEVEEVITSLNKSIYYLFDEAPQLMPTTFELLSNVLEYRSTRIHHSGEHMPRLLKDTLRYAAFLLIILSLFIAIKSIWLDALFTGSIASLSYAIFLVLNDLDNPLEPGDWHLTTDAYKALLNKIS